MGTSAPVALGIAAFLAVAAAALDAAGEHGGLAGRAVAGGRPAAEAVIWLDAPGAPRPREGRFVIRQRNMEFVPRVLVAPVGSTVELPNDDRIFHNVFSFSNGKPFDLGLYPTGASKRITLDRPAVNRLYCNIHPHMAAYIVAVDSPYYATTGKSGEFTMRDVPAGRYTYHAWRSGADDDQRHRHRRRGSTARGDAGDDRRCAPPRSSSPRCCSRRTWPWRKRSTSAAEVDVTVGGSTEDVRAAGTQARVFGYAARATGVSTPRPPGPTRGASTRTPSAPPIPTTSACVRWSCSSRRR